MNNQAPPNPRSEEEALQLLAKIPFSNYAYVKQAVESGAANTFVTLVRGASTQGGTQAAASNSAGGVAPDPNCGRPSEESAVSQVGGSQPGKAQEKLPEFTCKPEYSVKWARRGGWLVIRINAKYLVKGDVGQEGWVCKPEAPIAGAFIPHPNPVAMNIPNAD